MLRQLNETATHGHPAGADGQPERSDWTIDQGWANYTSEEHAVWKTLFERQSRLLPGRACDVIGSLDELLALAHIDFAPVYEAVKSKPDFEPGDVRPGDQVLARGTGRYHQAKRQEPSA